MGTIFATDRDGQQYELAGRDRASLKDILKQGGLALEALCGGSCLCATCHVYIEPDWLDKLLPPTENEIATLHEEGEAIRDNSRLSCQIQWHPGLDGLRLRVAPEV